MIDAEGVLAGLAAAFPSEPVPARDVLLNRHCCECVEVSEAFGYKPWPAVTLDELRAGGETALLTPTAWRYYLPAMITWCVRAPETVDVIQDNLVYQLEPPEPADEAPLHEWFRERAEGFTDAQRRAILGYLEWYRERQEAEYLALKVEPPKHIYRALEHWKSLEEKDMLVKRLTPILNVSNIQASFAWFEKLGWTKGWDWGDPPTFGGVCSGECEIFLCENGQGGRGKGGGSRTFGPGAEETADKGVWMSIWVDDVDAVHRRCLDQSLDVTWPPTDMPWNVREMHVRHPDGHVFRISQSLGEEEPD